LLVGLLVCLFVGWLVDRSSLDIAYRYSSKLKEIEKFHDWMRWSQASIDDAWDDFGQPHFLITVQKGKETKDALIYQNFQKRLRL